MYLLSLSTLALLKCLLSLSFSPLSVCVLWMHTCTCLGGCLDLRFRAQGLGQAVYMYICVQSTRVSCMCMCTRMRVYTCVMYMLRVYSLGIRDQGRICICMYVYMYMCMYVYWCIYVGSCNICIPTGCICSLHVYL